MNYIGTAVSDIGIQKDTNQDSVCIKIANTKNYGQIVMAVICDGMGGLEKGEVASATVITAFHQWFAQQLPRELPHYTWDGLANQWEHLITGLNQKIMSYGRRCNVRLGTTVSAMLILEGKYMIFHVGDSRIYQILDGLYQMTEDQTFVAREVKAGNMTLEQARTDPRKNMLLQCVGASPNVVPEVIFGDILPEAVYMLCSDGLRHELTREELYESLRPDVLSDEKKMYENSQYLIDLVKQRNEVDNISIALLKNMA